MIINMGGGGSPGKIVTVHVTYGTGIGNGANVTCTNGKKTIAGTTDTSGDAVFKLSKGPWTITVKKAYSSSSKSINVVDDCTVNISLFAATINVTYPAGSVCTATDGVTTLTAPDTSGSWACVVPNGGTWTVTATDGASTKAETVDITQEGQELSIELSYRFYLFMEGHGMQNGFNFEASLSSYTSADNNRITYNNNCQVWGAFQIKPNIDMSIYKSICFDVDVEATWQSGSYSLVYGVGAYVSGFSDENQGAWAAKATSTVAGNPDRVVYRVDLSGVESTQYVKFVSRGTQGYVYNIWLE